MDPPAHGGGEDWLSGRAACRDDSFMRNRTHHELAPMWRACALTAAAGAGTLVTIALIFTPTDPSGGGSPSGAAAVYLVGAAPVVGLLTAACRRVLDTFATAALLCSALVWNGVWMDTREHADTAAFGLLAPFAYGIPVGLLAWATRAVVDHLGTSRGSDHG
jgi:hypothetical protein